MSDWLSQFKAAGGKMNKGPSTPGSMPKIGLAPSIAPGRLSVAAMQQQKPSAPMLRPSLLAPSYPAIPPAPQLYDPTRPVPSGLGGQMGPSDADRFGALAMGGAPEAPEAAIARQAAALQANFSTQQHQLQGVPNPTFSPYTPPSLPMHQQVPLPEYPDVQPSPLTMLLAAASAWAAPRGAGELMAAPLAGAQQSAQGQWQTAMQQYDMQQRQADQHYQDLLAAAQWQDAANKFNIGQQWDVNQEQYRRAAAMAPIAGGGAEAATTVAQAPGVITDQQHRLDMAAGADALRQGVGWKMAQNPQLMDLWQLGQVNPMMEAYRQHQEMIRQALQMQFQGEQGAAQRELQARGMNQDYSLGQQRVGLEGQRIGNEYGLGLGRLGLDARDLYDKEHGIGTYAPKGQKVTLQEFVEDDPEVKRQRLAIKTLDDERVKNASTPNKDGKYAPVSALQQSAYNDAYQQLSAALNAATQRYGQTYGGLGMPQSSAPQARFSAKPSGNPAISVDYSEMMGKPKPGKKPGKR